jgi:hypothetical protein
MARRLTFQLQTRILLLRSLVALLALVLLSPNVDAVALTAEAIRAASKIIILAGTYDPISNEQLAQAQEALENYDLVILIPTRESAAKKSLPSEERLVMLNLATDDRPNILIPTSLPLPSPAHLQIQLRQMNPTARISLDRVKSRSSKTIRSLLRANVDLFLNRIGPRSASAEASRWALVEDVPPPVLSHILEKGLYIDNQFGSSVSRLGQLKGATENTVMGVLTKFGAYENFKTFLVGLLSKKKVTTVRIDDKPVRIQKHIGSGLMGDAYIVEIDGKRMVAKIARSQEGAEANLRSIPIQTWAQERYGIPGPKLYAHDPEGKWILSELIEGESLSNYLIRESVLSSKVRQSVERMHESAKKLLGDSYISLDFAADNIIVDKNGNPKLVDYGPMPLTFFEKDTATLLSHWESVAASNRPSVGARPALRCEGLF